VPLLFASGTSAYVLAMVGSSLVVLAIRAYFVKRLLPGVALGRLAARALWPVGAAGGTVLAMRLALWGGDRPAPEAAAELVLFLLVYAAATFASERTLIGELRRTARSPAAKM
jgi:hypothetical protein